MKIAFTFMLFILVALQYRLWVGEGSIANISRLKQEIKIQQEENQRLIRKNGQNVFFLY